MSSCDKGLPGSLIGLNAGPEMLTLEQLGIYNARYLRGEIDEDRLNWAKYNACPGCGTCSFIGTAATMQIMAECFYYAGGVPVIMEEINTHLHLNVMTVTGKTLGENLKELKNNGFYERCNKGLQEFIVRYQVSLKRENIIRSYDQAIGTEGSIAVLRGNLALEGAVIKHTACPKEMFKIVLRAKPFDSEEECLQAVLMKKVQKGDAVFIRYEDVILEKRREHWVSKEDKYKKGVLRLLSQHATSPINGAYH